MLSLADGGEAETTMMPKGTNTPPQPGAVGRIVDRIKDGVSDAYWMQRAVRERYPAADAVLNFVPYVGAATNIDDVVQDVRSGDYSSIPSDAAGAALNVGATKLGLRGLSEVAKDAQRYGRSGGKVMATGVGMPTALYVDHYLDRQKAADEQYGDTPLVDIAKQLRSK